MICNPEKLFYGKDGEQYLLLVDLLDGTAIAVRAADVGGGGNALPTYLVELPE